MANQVMHHPPTALGADCRPLLQIAALKAREKGSQRPQSAMEHRSRVKPEIPSLKTMQRSQPSLSCSVVTRVW
jgi:hypothetical protein